MKTKVMFLTVSEAASRLGLTPAAVRRLERIAALKAHRTPRGVRFFELAEVEKLAAKRKEKREGVPHD